MTAKPKEDLLQPVTDDVRANALALIRDEGYGALASLEPETGHPICSRIGIALGSDGRPIFLTSSFSAHDAAVRADGRCSILVGSPGKGDPLAHGRITLIGRATRVEDDTRAAVREDYLAKHPKAKLYIDFGDMSLWQFVIERASYNAGFGKAHEMDAGDFA